ncbi:hypothetical protein PVL29_024694 [Vitis rotundifolia]|uniref:V-type proton ATPase subunit G n=1 Tax=Vitis rotundifolia TaxID=103349 RepID=A0AA38YSH4_VITRO|nr:hypothetical protein PVL29_024694 [Vitis rotundifolia]
MDSIKGQGGIQMLLTAELNKAKEEVEREVKLYHSNMEAPQQKKISEETAMRIQSLKKSASRVSSDVVSMLIKHVTTVEA